MQGDLCYHFKCIYLFIMMELSDSRVNSATDMCFRDYLYCVFCKGNVHGTLSCNAQTESCCKVQNHCITKVSELQ